MGDQFPPQPQPLDPQQIPPQIPQRQPPAAPHPSAPAAALPPAVARPSSVPADLQRVIQAAVESALARAQMPGQGPVGSAPVQLQGSVALQVDPQTREEDRLAWEQLGVVPYGNLGEDYDDRDVDMLDIAPLASASSSDRRDQPLDPLQQPQSVGAGQAPETRVIQHPQYSQYQSQSLDPLQQPQSVGAGQAPENRVIQHPQYPQYQEPQYQYVSQHQQFQQHLRQQ